MARPKNDLTGLSELAGVDEKVRQNLAQPTRVAANHGWRTVPGHRHQLESPGLRRPRQQIHGLIDNGGQAELDVFDLELAGFDL